MRKIRKDCGCEVTVYAGFVSTDKRCDKHEKELEARAEAYLLKRKQEREALKDCDDAAMNNPEANR